MGKWVGLCLGMLNPVCQRLIGLIRPHNHMVTWVINWTFCPAESPNTGRGKKEISAPLFFVLVFLCNLPLVNWTIVFPFPIFAEAVDNLRLLNLNRDIRFLAGSCWRTKNGLILFLGQFLIWLIIRFLFVLIFLLSERILSENAVVGSWAQVWLVRSKFPHRKWEKGQ